MAHTPQFSTDPWTQTGRYTGRQIASSWTRKFLNYLQLIPETCLLKLDGLVA